MTKINCKIHGNVDAFKGKEPDGQVHLICPYCDYEKKIEQLTADFLKAYHATPVKKMMEELHTFLCRTIFLPFGRNKHYVWLLMMIERYKDSEEQDLPAMTYGMINDAFSHLLEVMKWARKHDGEDN